MSSFIFKGIWPYTTRWGNISTFAILLWSESYISWLLEWMYEAIWIWWYLYVNEHFLVKNRSSHGSSHSFSSKPICSSPSQCTSAQRPTCPPWRVWPPTASWTSHILPLPPLLMCSSHTGLLAVPQSCTASPPQTLFCCTLFLEFSSESYVGFRSLLKCYHIREASPDYPLESRNPPLHHCSLLTCFTITVLLLITTYCLYNRH